MGMSSGIYMSATPIHRCTLPEIDTANVSESDLNQLFLPWDDSKDQYSSCHRYDYNLTACAGSDDVYECLKQQKNHSDIRIINCDNGYQYENDVFLSTPVSEFDLVCGDKSYDSLANTLFFLGFFIGSLFIGPLADWFGRITAMRVTCLGLAVFGTLTAFVTSYTSYAIMRMATASFNITLYICFLTYVNEITTTRLRTITVILDNCSVALSHILYPWMCYVLGDWRYIHVFISCLALPFMITSCFIPETPRWLATKGKYKELKSVLSKYAKSNGKELTEEMWFEIKSQAEKTRRADEYGDGAGRKVAVWDLFKRPMMRLMSMNTMFMWFTVAMVYYGLILNGGKLSGDFYINNTFNSAVEVIGDTAIAFAVSFALIYIVTCEIFPTEARATAISMGSMSSRIGSMLSPFILQINDTYPWFTQTVFGTLSIIAGFMTFLFPETNGVEFSNSLDEAEDFYRKNIAVLKFVGNSGTGYHKGITTESTAKIYRRNSKYTNPSPATSESSVAGSDDSIL